VGSIAEGVSRSGPRPPKPIRLDMAREDLQELVKNAEPELFELRVDGEKFAIQVARARGPRLLGSGRRGKPSCVRNRVSFFASALAN
jgi:hypothetical protein